MRIYRNENTGEILVIAKYEYYVPMSYVHFKKVEAMLNKNNMSGKAWQFIKKHYGDKIERWEDYEKHRFE